MSYRRRHRWFRRMVLGLAFSVAVFAGRASVAAAKVDEGVGSRYVSAGGWSGEVDMESGIPVSAGIPEGDEQFIDPQGIKVIPYLSHGILSEADAQAAAAEAIHDPYPTDVFVRPGEGVGLPDGDQIALRNALGLQAVADARAIHDPYLSDLFVRSGEAQGGPDGRSAQESMVIPYLSHGILGESVKSGPLNRVERALQGNPQVIPYLSHGVLTESDAQALAAQAIADPNLTRLGDRQVAADGDQVAMANAVESQRFVPGVTDFPTSPQADTPAVAASDGGSTVEWNEALTAGIGAFVLVLGLGLAFGYLKRPRLAGP